MGFGIKAKILVVAPISEVRWGSGARLNEQYNLGSPQTSGKPTGGLQPMGSMGIS
jgi:hypothetical protein